ncbi:Hypothetical predicted protein [Mytilus galloprovincialis]|uniref:Uncharacterized protein n=1 Tax=Mytilus galloprovincialis TaxID=29158 RepID=A0A8B6FS31_MYTGA|nr:Hypothetical predicted protein [Mytilus galloprovincialis]
MIYDAGVPDPSQIFSGSLSEGLDLPGSDIDVMYVLGRIDVILNAINVKHPVHRDTFFMEADMDNPRLTRIRLVALADREYFFRVLCPSGTCTGESLFLDTFHDFCIGAMTGKINPSYNKILLGVLESIKFGGIGGLITSVFKPNNENHRLLNTHSETSSIMLDFLFYRIIEELYKERSKDLSIWYKRLAFAKSLLTSESCTFIIDVYKHHYAEISQYVPQILPKPNTIGNKYKIQKCYLKHLQMVSRQMLYRVG